VVKIRLKFEKNRIIKISYSDEEIKRLREFFVNKLNCEEYETENFLGDNLRARVFRYTNNSIELLDFDNFRQTLLDDISEKLKNSRISSYIDFYDDINRDLYEIDFQDKHIRLNLAIFRLAENLEINNTKFISDIVIYIIYIMFKCFLSFLEKEKNLEFKLSFGGSGGSNE